MINLPKVTILIPVYNREKLIMETLNAAVSQTYKNIEIIVVDNKSTDGTYKLITEFSKLHSTVKVYQNEENVGPVRNWRRCLDYATGEYVKILWSDDLIAPTFLEKTLPLLAEHKEVGFVFTGTEIFTDNPGQGAKAYYIGNTGLYDTKGFIEGALLGGPFPVSPGNALFRRKDLEKNLIMDVPNKIGSDFKMHAIGNDLLIYLLTAKDYPKFAFISEALSFFRAHGDSITVSSDRYKLTGLYNIAKGYFVETWVTDNKLRKKFNARLLIDLLKIRGNNMSINRVQDFYPGENKVNIDYIFLGKLMFRKFLSLPSLYMKKVLVTMRKARL